MYYKNLNIPHIVIPTFLSETVWNKNQACANKNTKFLCVFFNILKIKGLGQSLRLWASDKGIKL